MSSSSASATWNDVPCDELGSNDVLRYDYELVSHNGVITGYVTSNTVSFSNLQCNTEYTFRVKAVTRVTNEDGEGPFSEDVTARTYKSEGKHESSPYVHSSKGHGPTS